MMSDEQAKVYFLCNDISASNVSRNGNSKSNQLSSIMANAFRSLKHRRFNPILCNGEEIQNRLVIKESDIFVIETFSGPVFEHLTRSGARIISPFIVKYCDSDSIEKPFESIPKRPFPIFSQCMRGLSITCSNFSTDVKKVIERKVAQMCGNYYKDLNKEVNFLVTDSVMTLKYKAAGSLGMSIVKIDWIDQCWDRFQYEFKRADSPEIVSQNRLPILHGLTIVISQLDSDERNKINELVTQHGGTYSAALKFNVPNTILLLRERSGEKFKFAILKRIPCLLVDWLYDSLEAKYALPEQGYYIDETQAQEESSKNVHISKNSVPALPVVRPTQSRNPPIAETPIIRPNLSAAAKASPNKQKLTTNITKLNSPSKNRSAKSLTKELVQLTSMVEDNSEFLADCGLFAIGFDSMVLEAIKAASRRCGALFLADFRPKFVTHVIVGPHVDSDDLELFKSNKLDKIVTIDWLMTCLSHKVCSSHHPYRYSERMNQSKKIGSGGSGSSDDKILSISADQICKRIDFKQSDMTSKSAKDYSQAMQSSQNFKSLARDKEEDCPIVFVGTPKQNVPIYDGATTTSDSNDEEDEDNGQMDDMEAYTTNSTRGTSKASQSSRERTLEEKVQEHDEEEEEEAMEDQEIAVVNADTVPLNQTSTSDDNVVHDEYDENDSIGMQDLSSINSREICFMFSGFEQSIKETMIEAVSKKLDVTICDEVSVNESVTHLILMEPFASEKTLSAIAAGIWILKPQFIHDSLKQGTLVREDEYEWGLTNSASSSKLQNRLMESAVKWRKHIASQQQKAFSGWNVLLLNQTSMIHSCAIILRSGGAKVHYLEEVIADSSQFRRLLECCKYAVIDIKFKTKPSISRSSYLDYVAYILKKSIPLIQHEVISRFIIQGPSLMHLEDKFKVSFEKIQAALATIS